MTNLNNMINSPDQTMTPIYSFVSFLESRNYSAQGLTEGPVYVGHCLHTAVLPSLWPLCLDLTHFSIPRM